MSLPRGVRRLLRLAEPERDVADEVSFHFEQTAKELVAAGMQEAEARAEAERRFGDVAAWSRAMAAMDRERLNAERRADVVGTARDVVVHALRSVARTPAVSAAVVATLALGLGANVVMLGIVDRLLLSPPPHVERPEQLRRLMLETWVAHEGERRASPHLAWPDVLDAAEVSGLAGVAAWQEQWLTLGHGADAREIKGVTVSGGYFEVLGVRPALGRLIGPADAQPDAEAVVVIGHGFWQSEFGGTTDVLGRQLDFGRGPVTVVGVAPPGLTSLRLARIDAWVPLVAGDGAAFTSRQWYGFAGVARLHEAVPAAQVEEELTARIRRGREELIAAGRFDGEGRMLLTPLLESRGPAALPESRVAKWLAGVSLVVLLIACANVANLLLGRVLRQRRENAVRLALGISRARLVSQLMVEGAVLGLAGGAVALVLAQFVAPPVSVALLPDLAWPELGWNRHVPVVAVLLALIAGGVAGIMPALQSSRSGPGEALRTAGAGGIGGAPGRSRVALVLVQAALSVILLVGAGLFVRSLHAVQGVDTGMRLDDVLYVQVRPTPGTTREERAPLGHAVLARLREHSLVEVAAGTGTAPFTWTISNKVSLPGVDVLPVVGSGEHWMVTVTPDYFDLLDIPLVRGRGIDERDMRSDVNVAVVNETMARALWPGQDAIGACILIGDAAECTRVIGIARNTARASLREPEEMQYYLPLRAGEAPAVVLVRARGGNAAAGELRRLVASVDPRIRYVDIETAAARLKPHMRAERLGAALFTGFGLLALLVAAFGLYAVLAADVAQRTRETGVRRALGARRSDIVRLVLRGALTVTLAGIAAGGAFAALLAPRLEDLLFGVGPHDLLTYAVVAVTLTAVAAAAAALPALRAAAVDPNVALRAD